MAILVTKFRYYKSGSSKARGGYLKYIATRDHVQKIDDKQANFDATEKQKELITAKTEALQSAKRIEELYANAISAMRKYSGNGSDEDETEDY